MIVRIYQDATLLGPYKLKGGDNLSNIDLNENRGRYDEIKVPLDLNINIEAGMKAGKRYRKVKRTGPLCGFAAVFLAFAISVNTSIAFAEAVKEIPILKDIAEILTVNEGIKYALEEGYIQNINKSVEVDGVKITITRIIGDYSELIIGYTVEGKDINKENFYGFDEVNIFTETGEQVGGFISYEGGDYSEDGLKPLKGESYVSIGNIQVEKLPKNLVFKFIGVINNNRYSSKNGNTIADKEISIPIELNDKIINVLPEIYTLNKSVDLGDKTLTIKEMRVYPMSTELILNYEVGDDQVFGWLDNCYLEDERGRTFGLHSGASPIGDNEYTITFNGGAYGKSKELKLYSSGMYYNPKEGRQLVVDLKNKTLIDGGQYGVELKDIRNYKEYNVNDETLGERTTEESWGIDEEEPKTDNSKENLVYKGVEISFRALPGYGITMMSLGHSNSNRSGMSGYIDEDNPVEAYLYFEKLQLSDDIITISMDALHSERNKTESFSVKLK